MEDVLSGFQKYKTLDKEIIKKYEDSLPEEIIHIWKKYGLGSILNGYLKLINPEEFKEIIDTSYFRKEVSIPVFATGMGDIITWEENKYLRLIEFRKGKFKGISAGFEFFLTDIKSEEFCHKYLDSRPYKEAVEKYGVLKYDECFGYMPLLGLGGTENIKNLKKVKIKEHILIITELLGPIQ